MQVPTIMIKNKKQKKSSKQIENHDKIQNPQKIIQKSKNQKFVISSPEVPIKTHILIIQQPHLT